MTPPTTRRRVLLSAFACGPDRPSEPGVGWNAVAEVARNHDVWVLTSPDHRQAIEAAAAREHWSAQFVFLDWPQSLGFFKRTRVGSEIQHYWWQIAAYLEARRLHAHVRFDVAHHVTLCRYWNPSFLPFLGIPFVWGPVGGGESAPKSFWPGLGVRGALFEALRECARFVCERDPLLRLAARRASLGIATTDATAARMRALGASPIEVFTQVALTEAEIAVLGATDDHGGSQDLPLRAGPIRFLTVARLIPWKGVHLGLSAFARMRHSHHEYWIVGTGPAESDLRALATRLGISDRVMFLGYRPRSEVLRLVHECEVLVHASLHDSGGAVCAEAMAAGRPVICLDLGGPAVQVTSETGIKVPARDPDQAIEDLASAMDRLSASPGLRMAMGRAARARVREHFSTSAARAQFARWYEPIITGAAQPQLGARAGQQPVTVSTWGAPIMRESRTLSSDTVVTPIVSAVMPTYNKGRWLQLAIDSVLAQTFTNWELIIVDDGSTDDTPEILARCTDPRITIQTLKTNVGRAQARNVAVRMARGQYIAICDSDDICAPTRFEEHVAFLDTHPHVGIVSSHIRQLSDRFSARIVFPLDHESIARRFAKGKMGAAHGASLIRAECFERLGLYCEDLRVAEDFELFRRFLPHYRFQTLPRELLLYRNELGSIPLRAWNELSQQHRYALYRSNCHGRRTPVLSSDEFVRSWRTRFFIYTVDLLRFVQFNLRAYVFSSHVLR